MPIRFGIADSSELGRRTVITVTGELDAVVASEVGDYVDHTFDTDGRLVLDLSGVTGVFDGTLEALALRSRRLGRRNDGLVVIVRDEWLRRSFEHAGLGRIVHHDQRTRQRPLSPS